MGLGSATVSSFSNFRAPVMPVMGVRLSKHAGRFLLQSEPVAPSKSLLESDSARWWMLASQMANKPRVSEEENPCSTTLGLQVPNLSKLCDFELCVLAQHGCDAWRTPTNMPLQSDSASKLAMSEGNWWAQAKQRGMIWVS